MSTQSAEKKEFFDALLEESCLFVKIYLGNKILTNEVFEEVFRNLPRIDNQENDLQRANLFLELQKVCLEKKLNRKATGGNQLELFTELPGKSVDIMKGEKEMGIYRALAYLKCLNDSSKLHQSDLSSIEDENLLVSILEFSRRLLLEKYLEDGEILKKEDYTRHEEMIRYLMGLLPDSDSLVVERKCRQDPDWQRAKVWSTKIISWYKAAYHRLDDQSSKITDFNFPEIQVLFEKRFLQSGDIIPAKAERKTVVSDDGKSDPGELMIEKDHSLLVFCLVGFVALLVGYFGWDEHQGTKVEPDISQDNSIDQSIENLVKVDLDDLTHLATQSANQVATTILAKQTILSISEMEKEIKVPSSLLQDFEKNVSQEAILSNLDSISRASPEDNVTLTLNGFEKYLGSNPAYLFKPEEESLGKIFDIRNTGWQIFFKRADWPNPRASFALPAAEYEIRLGSERSRFLILRGEVVRVSETSESNTSIPSYSMSLSRAWWLDEDQERKEINLGF